MFPLTRALPSTTSAQADTSICASTAASRLPPQHSRPGGSLLLSCKALSSPTACRFTPAPCQVPFPLCYKAKEGAIHVNQGAFGPKGASPPGVLTRINGARGIAEMLAQKRMFFGGLAAMAEENKRENVMLRLNPADLLPKEVGAKLSTQSRVVVTG